MKIVDIYSRRYTGTLAALHMVKALALLETKLTEQKARSRRQLQLEERKSAEARAADRLEVLANKLKEVEENMVEVATIIDFLVKSVFIQRWKDVAMEIFNNTKDKTMDLIAD